MLKKTHSKKIIKYLKDSFNRRNKSVILSYPLLFLIKRLKMRSKRTYFLKKVRRQHLYFQKTTRQ
jgi:hypothetical protein